MVAPPVSDVSSASGIPPLCLTTERAFSFPKEFPYEFDSALTSSPQEDETISDEEDDFLAGLTRRLAFSTHRLPSPSFVTDKAKPAKSSESTLNGGNRSPNGPFSQVTSPFREEDSLKEVANSCRNLNSFIPIAHFNYYYWLWQPPSSHYHQLMASPYPVKQPCTGTGVFLPRKYPTSLKKSAILPKRKFQTSPNINAKLVKNRHLIVESKKTSL